MSIAEYRRPVFLVRADVHANVAELRRYLGSVQRPLSLDGLAQLLNSRDEAKRNASTVKRWESGAEPDIQSIRMMAELAGVSFEEFALGAPALRGAEALSHVVAATAESPRGAKLEPKDVPAPPGTGLPSAKPERGSESA